MFPSCSSCAPTVSVCGKNKHSASHHTSDHIFCNEKSHRLSYRKRKAMVLLFVQRKRHRPTTWLLLFGFSISLTAVLIGISSLNAVLDALKATNTQLPVYSTMQNTGLSLALSIYLFSIVNCLVVTNYWMASKHREFAIRKAFGWANRQLIRLILLEMAKLLTVSFGISLSLLLLLAHQNSSIFSFQVTPFFLTGTLAMLLLTLFLSSILPVLRILKIHPAEVLS